MSVGAVGGVGAAGGGASSVGSVGAAAGGGASVGSSSSVGGGGESSAVSGSSPVSNGKMDNSSEASAGVAPTSHTSVQSSFSTQDFMALKQTSSCQSADSDMQGAPDLKKLLEWIIALKLLETMGKQQ